MNQKENNFVDDFSRKLGLLLKEMYDQSTPLRTLASLAGVDKDMLPRIFKGEIKSFRVLVALMAVIFESRGARLDDEAAQKKDDIHRFFVALEQSFRECLDAYEDAPDFEPGAHSGQINGSPRAPIPRIPMDENKLKQSRLMTLLINEIKLFLQEEHFEKENMQVTHVCDTINRFR